MATSLDTLSLSQLLDVSIGTPQKGAVQLAAMRKLLQAVLEHLDVQYLSSEEPWPGHLSGPSLADVAAEVKEIKKEMEVYKKHASKAPDEDNGTRSASKTRMAEDMKKFQESRDEVNSCREQADMSLSQDLRVEIDRIKAAQTRMAQKVKELAALMKKLEEDIKKLREDTASWKEETSKEMSQQIEAVLQGTKSELQKMEEQQEMRNTMLEQLVTETANKLNEQLGEIGEISGSKEEEQEDEQEKAKAECLKCTFDINELLGDLLQRCEKLQEQVESLESRHMAMGKLKRIMRNWGQDQERLHHVEATVVQIQGDCEKLSFASGRLQKDSQQKQKAIEMLFQSLEKLQKEKADEQDMLAAMDLKADRAALGSKVNCSQFEANMERINERMQGLQSQISDQEQHWNTVQQQFSDAMEEKLSRKDLKAFQNLVEEMWKGIEEFKNETKECESAAGTKKQLPVPFTCLSCDRMLTMHVPGQYPETLPYLQPVPPSKEPAHSQRKPVHGSVSRVSQNSGDHQSSSFTLPPIQGSAGTRIVPLPSKAGMLKPRGTQLLNNSGHISRRRNDQLLPVMRTKDEPGPGLTGSPARHSPPARLQNTGTHPSTPAP